VITAFGGVGEIGGNKFLIKTKRNSIFLDFGTSYEAEGCFFEEFLQPRTGCALHDLIKLGILPKINGIYRQDALMPLDSAAYTIKGSEFWDIGLRSYEVSKAAGEWTPDAVFISHAHDDHFGYLPLLGNISVVCSKITQDMMKAISDVGNLTGFDSQLTEMNYRRVGKLGEKSYFPNALKAEFDKKPNPRDFKNLEHGQKTDVGGIKLTAFRVDHSVPGALACLLEADKKSVLYTGDIRFHGRQGYRLQDDLEGLRPDVMLCEGTRIDEKQPDNETQVQADLTNAFKDSDGLAMVGFAWKDLDRYETVKEAARDAGRIPVFDPRLAYLLARLGRNIYDEESKVFLERTDSLLYSKGDYTTKKHKIGLMPCDKWDSATKTCSTEHFDNGVSAVEIRKDPSKYVVQLDYFRFKNILDFDPPADSIFVRAQCEPFNKKMELSEVKLKAWLKQFGINSKNSYEPIQIHASGHASGPEIQELIDSVKPKTLIPIHTTKPKLFTNAAGKIQILDKGGFFTA
jgi:ribonuclease J